MRAAITLFAALAVVSSVGCASQKKMERQVHDARMRAASAEQRAAEIDMRLRSIETSMILQQSMLGRTMAKQDATDRDIAALGDGLGRSAQTPGPSTTASAPPAPPPKELIDLSGQAIVVGADDATVRDLLSKVEKYMGRPLTATERLTLGQVLRRPRVIDTTDPWGSNVFDDR
jgi:hypothetical protein